MLDSTKKRTLEIIASRNFHNKKMQLLHECKKKNDENYYTKKI